MILHVPARESADGVRDGPMVNLGELLDAVALPNFPHDFVLQCLNGQHTPKRGQLLWWLVLGDDRLSKGSTPHFQLSGGDVARLFTDDLAGHDGTTGRHKCKAKQMASHGYANGYAFHQMQGKIRQGYFESWL